MTQEQLESIRLHIAQRRQLELLQARKATKECLQEAKGCIQKQTFKLLSRTYQQIWRKVN
jgi:hypothetical protein